MFVQDREVEIAIKVDSGEATPRVSDKQIWLLEGEFTSAELDLWVDDTINGRLATIQAQTKVVSISTTRWPDIDLFLPDNRFVRLLYQVLYSPGLLLFVFRCKAFI